MYIYINICIHIYIYIYSIYIVYIYIQLRSSRKLMNIMKSNMFTVNRTVSFDVNHPHSSRFAALYLLWLNIVLINNNQCTVIS